MPYSAEISRSNPTCFLFLIDQSKSMGGPLSGDAGKKKADAVADSVNRLLYTLVLRCVWGQNVLDRFHIGVIGYGRQIASGLAGALAGRDLAPIGEVARNPLRIEQRARGTRRSSFPSGSSRPPTARRRCAPRLNAPACCWPGSWWNTPPAIRPW